MDLTVYYWSGFLTGLFFGTVGLFMMMWVVFDSHLGSSSKREWTFWVEEEEEPDEQEPDG